jgi:hypothetical protein
MQGVHKKTAGVKHAGSFFLSTNVTQRNVYLSQANIQLDKL